MIRPMLFAIALLSAAPVLAAPADEDQPLSVRVSYADLDLARPEDRAVLKKRILHAAYRVCPEVGSNDWKQLGEMLHCRQVAVRTAGVQVAQAELERGKATRIASAGR